MLLSAATLVQGLLIIARLISDDFWNMNLYTTETYLHALNLGRDIVDAFEEPHEEESYRKNETLYFLKKSHTTKGLHQSDEALNY